mmetsp:Transcript_25081/g.45632  ORF Transcript_25081/g.45632 Transcript_25081/m.45632 type:complete len:82 (+) Transcript_25081:1197-1442(+)
MNRSCMNLYHLQAVDFFSRFCQKQFITTLTISSTMSAHVCLIVFCSIAACQARKTQAEQPGERSCHECRGVSVPVGCLLGV